MTIFKLEKPSKEFGPGEISKIVNSPERWQALEALLAATTDREYRYWDKVKYKRRPDWMSAELLWSVIKTGRRISQSRTTSIVTDVSGERYHWQRLPRFEEFTHEVDMNLGGQLQSHIVDSPSDKQLYITRGIIEEAIASSQLEGANTERRYAKRMLQEKRKPRNISDQMIVNNYRAMQQIEGILREQEMSQSLLLQLHETLTKDTLENPKDVGRFRRTGDDIVVEDPSTQVVYHQAPPVRFLKRELKRLIEYANDVTTSKAFEHPVFKAIILHFWIGYLHPFVDGNGRVARALFYWYMLRKGYWAITYLPISRVIKKSPAQYRDAYIYSEQDDCDLTYFIDYNVAKISQARREFDQYVQRKQQEQQKLEALMSGQHELNERQVRLLRYLHKNPTNSTSIASHAEIYGVTRLTARRDLESLEEKGLLASRKVGRRRPFTSTDKLKALFDSAR